jgi:hypothetical protein
VIEVYMDGVMISILVLSYLYVVSAPLPSFAMGQREDKVQKKQAPAERNGNMDGGIEGRAM